MSKPARNPHFGVLALTTAELTVGRRVRMHSPGQSQEVTIVSVPFDKPNGSDTLKAIRLKHRNGQVVEFFLTDLGVEPYHTGAWNRTNYVIAL